MRFLLSLLLATASSLILGIGSAWYMVAAPRTGTVTVGGWVSQPTVDATTADPYTKARIARSGEFGMGAGEGITFVAEADEGKQVFDGRCDWRISGVSPSARLWTLTAVDGEGRSATTPEGRAHVDNVFILRDGLGHFDIALSSKARPGNWLPVPEGRFRLVLRLYDTSISLITGQMPELPSIAKGACR